MLDICFELTFMQKSIIVEIQICSHLYRSKQNNMSMWMHGLRYKIDATFQMLFQMIYAIRLRIQRIKKCSCKFHLAMHHIKTWFKANKLSLKILFSQKASENNISETRTIKSPFYRRWNSAINIFTTRCRARIKCLYNELLEQPS